MRMKVLKKMVDTNTFGQLKDIKQINQSEEFRNQLRCGLNQQTRGTSKTCIMHEPFELMQN